MKLSALLAPLIAAKVPHDQILAVIVAFESEEEGALERRRKADAERQARHRSRDVTLRHSDRSLTRADDAREEDLLLDKEIEVKKERKMATASPRSELERILDSDHAGWVIDHRQRLRKPLTSRAANQLAAKLALCPNPNTAADLMIEKGWLSVEVEWLTQQPRGSPASSPKGGIAAVAARLAKEFQNAELRPDPSITGLQQTVLYLPIANSGK